MSNQRVAIYHRLCPYIENDTMQELRDYAKAQDWEVIEYVESKGKGQPVLSNLLRDGKNGNFDVVLVRSLLPIGNSLKQVLTVIDKLKAFGIGIISFQDGLNMDSSAGTLLDALMTYLKQSQSFKIRIGLELSKLRNKNILIGRPSTPKETVSMILAPENEKLSIRDIAKKTRCPKSTVYSVLKNHRESQPENTVVSVQVGGML